MGEGASLPFCSEPHCDKFGAVENEELGEYSLLGEETNQTQ